MAGREILPPGACSQETLPAPARPPLRRAPPARPASGPHLCNYPLASLPAAAAAKFTQREGQEETRVISSRPAPRPKPSRPGCPGSPPPTAQRSAACPGLGVPRRSARPRAPRSRPAAAPGFPSAAHDRALRLPLSPPQSCFHGAPSRAGPLLGSLRRPLLTNSSRASQSLLLLALPSTARPAAHITLPPQTRGSGRRRAGEG